MLNLGLDAFLVMFFLAHVYFAFQSFRSNKDQQTGLLRKGVVDSVFRKASKAFYLLLIPAVFITELAAWSILQGAGLFWRFRLYPAHPDGGIRAVFDCSPCIIPVRQADSAGGA